MRLLMLVEDEGGRLVPGAGRAVGAGGRDGSLLEPARRGSRQLALGERAGLPVHC